MNDLGSHLTEHAKRHSEQEAESVRALARAKRANSEYTRTLRIVSEECNTSLADWACGEAPLARSVRAEKYIETSLEQTSQIQVPKTVACLSREANGLEKRERKC